MCVLTRILAAEQRLIQIVGPAGVGKSALLRSAQYDLNARVLRIDPGWSLDTLCTELTRGFETSASDLIAQPDSHLTPRARLEAVLLAQAQPTLVLDQVEAGAQGLFDLLGHLLRRVPRLRVLIASESEMPITADDRTTIWMRPFGRKEAVEHFREAAMKRGRSDELEHPGAEALIERIVTHLRGLRLAIDHAVTRLDMLSLAELAQQPPEDLLAIASGPSSKTMLDTSRETWSTLDPDEQALLGRLAVFVDSIPRKAVVAVSGWSRPQTLNVLGAIIRKSLVWQHSEASRRRFVLDPSLRICALEQTPADQLEAYRLAHADWWLEESFAHALRAIGGPDDGANARRVARRWLSEAEPELIEIRDRAAARLPVDLARGQRAVFCMSPLIWPWLSERETREMLERWAEPGAEAPAAEPRVRGELRRLLGRALRYTKSGADTSRAVLAEAMADARSADDPLLAARIYNAGVELYNLARELDAAERDCERALTIYRAHGVHGWTGISLCQMGRIRAERFDRAQAEALWREALEALARVEDHFFECLVRKHLTSLAIERLDLKSAEVEAKRALELASRLGLERDQAIIESYDALCKQLGDASPQQLVEVYARLLPRLKAKAPRFAAYFHYYRALVWMELDTLEHATADLISALECGDPRYRVMIACAQAAISIRAGGAEVSTDEQFVGIPGELADELGRLTELPAGARSLQDGAIAAATASHQRLLAEVNDDYRVAARVLGAWIAEAGRWRVDHQGRWVQPPRGERVTIARPLLACILRVLLDARRAGLPLASYQAFIDGCWPDERGVDSASIMRRLRTHKYDLGKLFERAGGSPDLIETVASQGYRLAPHFEVEIVVDAP